MVQKGAQTAKRRRRFGGRSLEGGWPCPALSWTSVDRTCLTRSSVLPSCVVRRWCSRFIIRPLIASEMISTTIPESAATWAHNPVRYRSIVSLVVLLAAARGCVCFIMAGACWCAAGACNSLHGCLPRGS